MKDRIKVLDLYLNEKPTVSESDLNMLLYCLKLKGSDNVKHCYFMYMEEIPFGGEYMEAGSWKYAHTFRTKKEAQEFKGKNDVDDLYEIESI